MNSNGDRDGKEEELELELLDKEEAKEFRGLASGRFFIKNLLIIELLMVCYTKRLLHVSLEAMVIIQITRLLLL